MCRNISVICPETHNLFLPFLKIFKSEFLIETLISQLTVSENVLSLRQNRSLGIVKQKYRKLKLWLFFNDSLITLKFFTQLVHCHY